MRRLILFRHAKTEARAPSGEDIDRALTQRGRTDADAVGQRLARARLAPDLALVSSARRALETWICVKAMFPRARVEIRPGLYNATPEEVSAEIEAAASTAATVMVVGHNPSFQELAIDLLVEGSGSPAQIESVSARFPTATAAVFRLDEAGRASLEGLFHAKDSRGDGG